MIKAFEKKNNCAIITDVRLSFVFLDKKQVRKGTDGKPDVEEWVTTLLIPKTEEGKAALAVFRKVAINLMEVKYGSDHSKWTANVRNKDLMKHVSEGGQDGWFIRDGDAVDYDGYAGHWYIKAANRTVHPFVTNISNQDIDPAEVYSGCYGDVAVSFFAYPDNIPGLGKKCGVGVSLQGVRFRRDGEAFGAPRAKAADLFEEEEMEGADDPNNYNGSDEL